ncbi:MAG: phosphatase PAP2 family protein [Emergencia sp.]|nr:phosphatase PAP2 family protein [Emergencia sp.]
MREKGKVFRDYIFTHRYILLILYVPIYLISFFAVELLVPESADYWVSYCSIDDWIPFCEYFIIPYYLWYPLLFAVGLYLLWKDVPVYKRYMYCIIIGFSACVLICAFFPNGQDLRPEVFPRDNIFTTLVRNIYQVDTNTNVIPSVHAVGAIFAAIAVCSTKTVKKYWVKIAVTVLAVLICMATCLVKQHSILDVFAAIGLCAAVYPIVCIIMKKSVRIS